ncbi:aa3-type cytochrome c oxidase subunit IV [Roseovarius spongiae]|uniref:Aa3-type cytochrome c oxidase subunit IV n=1 Tax=Roseovarius spongiae TaxID=2320272 RepID=A0A3A8AWD3_9RHOB|nr:aa3-type cytochrome c oxidase subunit IV [Roseovarius spongiae]RKF16037.1 aa3-type cytochrome c oxidase subunit IV [Roseovarius spongiae]
MAEHEHGDMRIEDHEKTFDGFLAWMIRGAIVSIVALIFLAIFNS